MAEEKRKRHYSRADKVMQNKIIPDEKVARRINKLHSMLWELDPVDLNNIEEVNERTILFFQMCDELGVKALWETYAYALGYTTVHLRNVMNGVTKRASKAIIEKAHWRLKSDLAQLASAGQVNPVVAIFLQKNNYGYVDKVEISATTSDPLGEQESLVEIKRRLIESVPQDDVVGEASFVEVPKPEEVPAGEQ